MYYNIFLPSGNARVQYTQFMSPLLVHQTCCYHLIWFLTFIYLTCVSIKHTNNRNKEKIRTSSKSLSVQLTSSKLPTAINREEAYKILLCTQHSPSFPEEQETFLFSAILFLVFLQQMTEPHAALKLQNQTL